MIEQSVALEHLRSELTAAIGRPVYIARTPTEPNPSLPYAILYSLPVALRPPAPLSDDPGIWRVELQCTAVGRNLDDAGWMASKMDDALRAMGPPAGYNSVAVESTVAPTNHQSVGVTTIIQRWAVAI